MSSAEDALPSLHNLLGAVGTLLGQALDREVELDLDGKAVVGRVKQVGHDGESYWVMVEDERLEVSVVEMAAIITGDDSILKP